MKFKYIIILSAICYISLNQASSQSIFEKWKELNDYHTIMSLTFHPAEEDNLEPLKSKSGEMVDIAKALSKSTIPAEFKSEKIEKTVTQLVTDTKALHKMVKGGKSTDEQLKQAIYSLHDVFHEIVGLCSGDDH